MANITPEVVAALALLRRTYMSDSVEHAFDVLDNAGVFTAIDEAAGYGMFDVPTAPSTDCDCQMARLADHDYDCTKAERVSCCTCTKPRPEGAHWTDCPKAAPVKVSKCTCPSANIAFGGHLYTCPRDPAEWGDMTYAVIGEKRSGKNPAPVLEA